MVMLSKTETNYCRSADGRLQALAYWPRVKAYSQFWCGYWPEDLSQSQFCFLSFTDGKMYNAIGLCQSGRISDTLLASVLEADISEAETLVILKKIRSTLRKMKYKNFTIGALQGAAIGTIIGLILSVFLNRTAEAA